MIKSINNISALKLINEVDNLLILDVRRFSEFKSGKIPNSINIPVDDLEFELDELNEFKEKPILVYCKSGIRSTVACTLLEEEGFSNLYNLRGGILDYTGNIE
ncbi:rhodanese-like domain-containing protein [Clostridium sp. NSJ-6]|uniref:Rhodanese-like domain-containing protein n=1 Tax=Clostridium hominis TaxID=2763036 RepID=A0ABR7D7M2_9CLOT|nr:rhodanese-like domain-containing protein [Clostridium hominis]MBC5627360.1 rhodanese-like domain-containing protein [Clostridium hominis]